MITTREALPTGLQLTALDAAFAEHPHDRLDRLRAEDPVHRDLRLRQFFPTRFDDVKAVVFNRSLSADPRNAPPDSFHRRAVLGNTPVEDYEPTMLFLDDPDHKRIRGLVTRAFNQQSVDAIRPRVRAVAEELLDALRGRESFDLIAEFAAPFPIIVIAEMLGVDPGDLDRFKQWSDTGAQLFNPARTPEQSAALADAQQRLFDYFTRAADARRRDRRDDLISALVAAEETGDRLTTREIALTCKLLLVAGNLTTTDLIGNGVLALLRHPDQLALLRARPELVPNAVEEMLRYDPPVSQTSRIAREPLTLGETRVEAGEVITASLLAAGRDPAKHTCPHRFDVERADTSHVAFGGGGHYCVGAPLARAEAQIAIPLLLERFPGLRLDPDRAIEHKRVPMFNGLEALWVRTG
jgi:cytochrome P450